MPKLIDRLQDQHGHWTVLRDYEPIWDDASRQYMIMCQCVCGTIKTVRLDRLIYADHTGRGSRSCGCRRGEHLEGSHWPTIDGQNDPKVRENSVHNWWTALGEPYRQDGKKNSVADFRCKCGTEKTLYTFSVLNGDSQSCGCWKTQAARQIIRV